MPQEEDETEGFQIYKQWGDITSKLHDISGLVIDTYENVSGTFNSRQRRIVQEGKLEENLRRLVRLTEKQTKEADQRAKTDRTRFYISTAIAVIAIIAGIIIAIFF